MNENPLLAWYLNQTIEAMRNKIHFVNGLNSQKAFALDKEFCEVMGQALSSYKEEQILEAMHAAKDVIVSFNIRLFIPPQEKENLN